MCERNNRPDILEQATRALQDAPAPNGISPELVAATVAAIEKQLAPIVPMESVRDTRRKKIMRYLRYGSLTALAASVAIALGVLLLFGDNRAVALDKILDKIEKAETVQYTANEKLGDFPETTMQLLVKGPKARIEIGSSTMFILDTKKRESLMLIPMMKRYVVNGGTVSAKSPIDKLLAFRNSKTEDLGSEKINGKEVKKLGLKNEASLKTGEPAQSWLLWVDKKTDLLVKAQLISTANIPDEKGALKVVGVVTELDNFIWNEKLDDKLFDMTPPADYKEGFPGRKD
jgi:outer membrane lipoprotein-sorting protein